MGIGMPAFSAGGCGNCGSCPRPEIRTEPASVAVCTGAEAELTVTAFGLEPIEYQWYEGESGDTSTPLEGETTDTLQVTPEETTPYWVRVTNPCGSADSDTAIVTVNTAPAIDEEPASVAICEGGSTELEVVASGAGPLTYQWYEGESGNTGSPIMGATSSTYTAEPGATQDYWVRVTNACGSTDSATATVTVNVAPEITAQPASTSYNGITPASLSVTATGTAPLTYQWQSAPSDAGPWTNIPGETADTLEVTPAELTWYRVVVTNACGTDTSDPAEVSILLVEASSDGGSTWAPLTPGVTHDASNLSAGAGVLQLRVTSPIEITLASWASLVPQVLTGGPATPLTIPAATPTVLLFVNADPGLTDFALLFDEIDSFQQTFTCYTLDGIIRGVTSGALPGTMQICFAPIAAADVSAAVAYATPAAAVAASATDDWIVGLEASEFDTPSVAIGGANASRICSDDSVAPTLGRYGDGFRLAAAPVVAPTLSIAAGATVAIHDIGLAHTAANGQALISSVNNATVRVERCRLLKSGTFDAIAETGPDSVTLVANCYVQCGASAKGLALAATDLSFQSVNNTIIAVDAADTGVWGGGVGQRPECSGTYAGAASGATWSAGAFSANTAAAGVGGNGSDDGTAPGTTTYTVAASAFIANDTVGTLNMAPINRATLAMYPCENAAAISARDVDRTPRSDWFMGAKWIAP